MANIENLLKNVVKKPTHISEEQFKTYGLDEMKEKVIEKIEKDVSLMKILTEMNDIINNLKSERSQEKFKILFPNINVKNKSYTYARAYVSVDGQRKEFNINLGANPVDLSKIDMDDLHSRMAKKIRTFCKTKKVEYENESVERN